MDSSEFAFMHALGWAGVKVVEARTWWTTGTTREEEDCPFLVRAQSVCRLSSVVLSSPVMACVTSEGLQVSARIKCTPHTGVRWCCRVRPSVSLS